MLAQAGTTVQGAAPPVKPHGPSQQDVFNLILGAADLTGPEFAVMMVFAAKSDWIDAKLPGWLNLDLTTLAKLARLGRSTAARALNSLGGTEAENASGKFGKGYLRRHRPEVAEAIRNNATTWYEFGPRITEWTDAENPHPPASPAPRSPEGSGEFVPGSADHPESRSGTGVVPERDTNQHFSSTQDLKKAPSEQASRRAQRKAPREFSDTQKISIVRQAADAACHDGESIDERQALDLWARFITPAVGDPFAYLKKIFTDIPDLWNVIYEEPEADTPADHMPSGTLPSGRAASWPAWCGSARCNERTSQLEDPEDGHVLARCQECHPQPRNPFAGTHTGSPF